MVEEERIKEYVRNNMDYLQVFRWDSKLTFRDFIIDGERVNNSKVYDMMFEDMTGLEEYSYTALTALLSNSRCKDTEMQNAIQSAIVSKLDKEPFYIDDMEISFMLKIAHSYNLVANKLSKDVIDKIIDNIRSNASRLRGQPVCDIISKMDNYFDCANIIKWADQIDEEKVEMLNRMYSENRNALKFVNYEIFLDDIYTKFSKSAIERISRFPGMSAKIIQIAKSNPDALEAFAKYFDKDQNFLENLEEFNIAVTNFFALKNEVSVNSVNFEDKDNVMSWLIGANSKTNLFDMNFRFPIEYSENYEEVRRRKCLSDFDLATSIINENMEKMQNENISMFEKENIREAIAKASQKKKDAYFNYMYGMTYEEAAGFVKDYGSDLKNIENVDDERKLVERIKNELQAGDRLDSFIKEGTPQSLYKMFETKKKIARECAKTYMTEFKGMEAKVEDCIKSTDENLHEIVIVDGEKVDIVKPKGKMDMLLHSIDTGFLEEKKAPESYVDVWNNQTIKEDHILSTVYVNQDFMGMPPVGDAGVMYAFTDMPRENIKLMGVSDINTYSKSFAFDSSTRQYMSAQTMGNTSRRVYNEFAIERSKPNYVVLFDDSSEVVKENSLKAAKEFGIPIVYLDKKEIAEEQVKALQTMLDKFEEEKNPEVLSRLINKYETNMSGWLLNRSEVEDKSNTSKIDNSRFASMFDDIGGKIIESAKSYIEHTDGKGTELLTIAKTIVEEQELYETNAEQIGEKKISPTAMTQVVSQVKEKLNDTFRSNNMEAYVISEKMDYDKYIRMLDITKCAICREQITFEELKNARQIEEHEKKREEQSR